MNPIDSSTTTKNHDLPGSVDNGSQNQPGSADAPTTPQDGSPVVPDPLQPVAPVVPDGQPVVPTAPVVPAIEPPVDPLADVLKTDAGKQNIDMGKIDFDKAADKHFEEFSTSLSEGDPQLVEKLSKLKPKMLEQVVSRLGKKFTIGDGGAEFSTMEELSAALGHNSPHNEAGIDEVAVTNLKSNIENKFLLALETKGIKLEDFKKTPQYVEVAQKAADKIAWMKKKGMSFSDFDQVFDFDSQFKNAMHGVDAKAAVAQAQAAAQKIASASQGNPITTPAPLAGLQVAQEGKTFPSMVKDTAFFSMTSEQRKAYSKDWTDKSGTIQFAK